jgi:Glucose-1-phosphate adenylyltransferase (EC 2.7.7.27)
MEKHPGKLFYRLSRLSPEDQLPLRRKPTAKVYANPLETQALPPFRPDGGPPLFRALSHLKPLLPQVGSALSLKDLSQILYPLAEREGGRGFPSAGEAYPLEAYLVTFRVEGVFPGVYHYFT